MLQLRNYLIRMLTNDSFYLTLIEEIQNQHEEQFELPSQDAFQQF